MDKRFIVSFLFMRLDSFYVICNANAKNFGVLDLIFYSLEYSVQGPIAGEYRRSSIDFLYHFKY